MKFPSDERHDAIGPPTSNGQYSCAENQLLGPVSAQRQTEYSGNVEPHAFAPPSGAIRSYAQVLDALPIVAFMATADGAITYVSRGWTECTGYPAGDALATGYREIIDPAQADGVVAAWAAAVSGGKEFLDEFRLRFHDGAYRWVLSQAAPVRDAVTGAVTAWFGTVTDVDERRRTADALVQSESMYRTLSEPYREPYGPRPPPAS